MRTPEPTEFSVSREKRNKVDFLAVTQIGFRIEGDLLKLDSRRIHLVQNLVSSLEGNIDDHGICGYDYEHQHNAQYQIQIQADERYQNSY